MENDALIGRTLGGCRIERLLGRGGMGAVYYAIQTDLERPVAVKVLPNELAGNEAFIARFDREAKTIAAISHPNIVQIHLTGHETGLHFIVMEWAEGRSLAELLKLKTRLPTGEACDIVVQCAEAIKAAWSRGVVHRDIKPDNIMIATGGLVKVADFGLAKNTVEANAFTRSGAVMGTPYYMSPEQCRGEPTDVRTDLYALGITFWECLAGRRPFEGEMALSVMHQHLSEPMPDLAAAAADVPELVGRLIDKMTQKAVDKRVQRPEEVIDALDKFLTAGGRRERARAEQAIQPHVEFKTMHTQSSEKVETSADLRDGECRDCRTRNSIGRKFCAKCGAALFDKCPACGFDGNALKTKFCGRCGGNLETASKVKWLGEQAGELIKRQQHEHALEILEEAKKIDPKHAGIARWAAQLREELDAIARLKKELSVHLEAGRFDQAERAADQLMRLLPGDSAVSALPGTVRDAARQKHLAQLEDEFMKHALAGSMGSATKVLGAIEPGPVQDRLAERMAKWRREFDDVLGRARELMRDELWKQAEPPVRRAAELDVESMEARNLVKACEARLRALAALHDEVLRAMTSGGLFKAFDLSAKVRVLDTAGDVLGDLPSRVAAKLDHYKTSVKQLRELVANRLWRDGLGLARALRELETADRDVEELAMKAERAVVSVGGAREYVERLRNDAMRFPDMATSLETLSTMLPEPDASAYRKLAGELKVEFLAKAESQVKLSSAAGRFKQAQALVSAMRPHDEAASRRAQEALRWWWMVRRAAMVLIGLAIGGVMVYVAWRLLTRS